MNPIEPRPPRPEIELPQLEAQIRIQRGRYDYALLSEKEQAMLTAAIAGMEERAAMLRDLIVWEKELAATA